MSNQVIFYIMGGSAAAFIVILILYIILSKKMQKSEYKQIQRLQEGTKENRLFRLFNIYVKETNEGGLRWN